MGLHVNMGHGRTALSNFRTFRIYPTNLDDLTFMEYLEIEGEEHTCVPNTRRGDQSFEALAERTKKSHCGNCQEMTAVVMTVLTKMKVSPREQMVLWYGQQYAHAFALIGRAHGSRANDPSTWGPDAVIVDPWHNGGKVYPATEINKEMFRGMHNHQGPFEPMSMGLAH